MSWWTRKRKRVALRATRLRSIDRFSHKELGEELGRWSLLHGFEPCVHACLAAGRSVAVQDGGVAHLVKESTQTAELGGGFANIISTE